MADDEQKKNLEKKHSETPEDDDFPAKEKIAATSSKRKNDDDDQNNNISATWSNKKAKTEVSKHHIFSSSCSTEIRLRPDMPRPLNLKLSHDLDLVREVSSILDAQKKQQPMPDPLPAFGEPTDHHDTSSSDDDKGGTASSQDVNRGGDDGASSTD